MAIVTKIKKNKPAPQEVPQVELNNSPAAESQQPQSSPQQESDVELNAKAPEKEAPHAETAAEANEEQEVQSAPEMSGDAKNEAKDHEEQEVQSAPEMSGGAKNDSINDDSDPSSQSTQHKIVAETGEKAQTSSDGNLAHGDTIERNGEGNIDASSQDQVKSKEPEATKVAKAAAPVESDFSSSSDSAKTTHGKETGLTLKQQEKCLTYLTTTKHSIINKLADNKCLQAYYNACKQDENGDSGIKFPEKVNFKILGAPSKDEFCIKVDSAATTKGLVIAEPVLQPVKAAPNETIESTAKDIGPIKEEAVSQPVKAAPNEFGIVEPTETTKYSDNLCFFRFVTLASEHWVRDEVEFATADLALHHYNYEMNENFKVLPQCSDFYKKLCANPENYQDFSEQYKKPLEDVIEDCQGINSFLSHYFYA